MIPIKQSELRSYFEESREESRHLKNIMLLSNQEADAVWRSRFDMKARHLFELPKSCWVHSLRWIPVGSWIEAYNDLADPAEVGHLIAKTSKWQENTCLLFVQSRKTIVQLSFSNFSVYWRDLLAALRDAPILISNDQNDRSAYSFTSIGQITKLETP